MSTESSQLQKPTAPVHTAPSIVSACRTALFYLVLVIITIAWAVPALIIGPCLPLRRRNFFIARTYSHMVIYACRWICGIRWNIKGLEHLPNPDQQQGLVLLSKHQSTWETLFLPTILSPHVQVVKKELSYLPIFGWVYNLIHPIFIDRSQKTNALKQVITQGSDRLNKGLHVLVFPEGTRVPPGKRKTFSKGGAMLASKTAAPTLFIAHNSGEFWPNDHWVKKAGVISVVISPVLNTEGVSTKAINDQSERWINAEVERVSDVKFSGDMVEAQTSGKRF